MKHLVVASLLALLFSLAACAPVTTMDFVTYKQTFVSVGVDFNPNAAVPGNPNELKVESSNQKCPPASASPGCVRFLENTFGALSFRLQGQGGSGARSCSDGGVNWVITNIAATVSPMTGNPKKGDGWGATLMPWVTKAFFPISDASKGVLYDESIANSRTEVTLLNLNNNKASDGVKTLYYRVTASKCDGSASKVSDPGVENEGLK